MASGTIEQLRREAVPRLLLRSGKILRTRLSARPLRRLLVAAPAVRFARLVRLARLVDVFDGALLLFTEAKRYTLNLLREEETEGVQKAAQTARAERLFRLHRPRSLMGLIGAIDAIDAIDAVVAWAQIAHVSA